MNSSSPLTPSTKQKTSFSEAVSIVISEVEVLNNKKEALEPAIEILESTKERLDGDIRLKSREVSDLEGKKQKLILEIEKEAADFEEKVKTKDERLVRERARDPISSPFQRNKD